MAEHETARRRSDLYVLGTEHGEKFFNGGRALSSCFAECDAAEQVFNQKFGDRYRIDPRLLSPPERTRGDSGCFAVCARPGYRGC